MPIEMLSSGFVCHRCGRAYTQRKNNFPVCYGSSYKGTGYLGICRECFKDLYKGYLIDCKDDSKLAVRQMCRKLDIYWNEMIYTHAISKSTDLSVMARYMAKINLDRYAGKSYDDTLKEEDRLWEFSKPLIIVKEAPTVDIDGAQIETKEDKPIEISRSIERYWGQGYDPEDYLLLEERLEEMLRKMKLKRDDLDIGTDKVIKQVCTIELDIEKARRAGRAIDKLQNTLNTYLGSANLKSPQQKSEESDAISGKPLGVLGQIYEEKRPIPEADPSLDDVDGIRKYITTWFFGHAAKMMKKNNIHVPLYEKAMEKFRVRHPNLEGEIDDDAYDEAVLDAELGDGEES